MLGVNCPAVLLQDKKLFAVFKIREQFDDTTDVIQFKVHLLDLTIS